MLMQKNKIRGLSVSYPIFEEVRYRKLLLALVNEIKSYVIKLIPGNKQFLFSFNAARRQDGIVEDLEHILDSLKFYASYKVAQVIKALTAQASRVNVFNNRAVANSLRLPAPTTTLTQPKIITNELSMWVAENSRLIKTIPERLLDRVEAVVYDAIRSGESPASLSNNLQKVFNITKNRANIIARDQIAKLQGNLTRARNLALGITQYQWLTSRDERVRHSHEVLESKICSWNNEDIYKKSEQDRSWKKRTSIAGVTKHPGQDILCRFTSLAIIGGLT